MEETRSIQIGLSSLTLHPGATLQRREWGGAGGGGGLVHSGQRPQSQNVATNGGAGVKWHLSPLPCYAYLGKCLSLSVPTSVSGQRSLQQGAWDGNVKIR